MESLPIISNEMNFGFIVVADNIGDVVWQFWSKFTCTMRQLGSVIGIQF
jgi:hypothetical protein